MGEAVSLCYRPLEEHFFAHCPRGGRSMSPPSSSSTTEMDLSLAARPPPAKNFLFPQEQRDFRCNTVESQYWRIDLELRGHLAAVSLPARESPVAETSFFLYEEEVEMGKLKKQLMYYGFFHLLFCGLCYGLWSRGECRVQYATTMAFFVFPCPPQRSTTISDAMYHLPHHIFFVVLSHVTVGYSKDVAQKMFAVVEE